MPHSFPAYSHFPRDLGATQAFSGKRDHSDKIAVGDVLYAGDDDEIFPTEAAAIDAGETVLSGLDGGRAFNLARDSATIVAVKKC